MEDDGDGSWDLIGGDLRLKSTFLYCDISRMISTAPKHHQEALTELANKLFYSIEEVILAAVITLGSKKLDLDRPTSWVLNGL